jgi:hypothetical protein
MSECKEFGKEARDNALCDSCRKKKYRMMGLRRRTFKEDLTPEGMDKVLEDLGRG